MRLHRLEITAFGPFAATTTVDFDALGADGLFLLHGRTGAGKTTVLDAIAFALYGRVPGARDEKRLHSDHADPQIAPRVVLEATMGGRRLRLVRRPEFQRPKKRGSGFTDSKAAATLEWLDGSGQNLSRISDIGDEIGRLLGMSADQFFQVVLLPQGEFAQFLHSRNEGRQDLLERLFDTKRFGAAENWLKERSKSSATELGSRRQLIERLIAQIAHASGVGDTETAEVLESVGWSQQLLATARAEAARVATELELRRAEWQQAQSVLEAGRRMRELHRRLTAARTQLAEYSATAAQRARRQEEWDRARRAEPVAATLAEARGAAVEAQRYEAYSRDIAERLAGHLLSPGGRELPGTYGAAVDLASSELSGSTLADDLTAIEPDDVGSGDTPAAAAGTLDAHTETAELEPFSLDSIRAGDGGTRGLERAVQRWNARIGALDEVRADADSATGLRAELVGLRSEQAELTAHTERLRDLRRRLPEAILAAEERARAAAEAAAALPGLTVQCERLRTAAESAVALARCRVDAEKATAALDSAHSAHLDARGRTLDVRERRLAGMAAELAGALVSGKPCAVCGSADHPAPARPVPAAASQADEQRAVAAERAAEGARDRALVHVTDLRRRIELLVERGGDGDRTVLAEDAAAATARLETARATAAEEQARDTELSRIRAEEFRLRDEAAQLEVRTGEVQTGLRVTDRRLAELTERLLTAAGADGSVEKRSARLAALVHEAGELRTARAETVAARTRLHTLARRVDEQIRAAGLLAAEATPPRGTEPDFAVLADYAAVVRAAERTAQRQAELEQELLDADRTRDRAESVLAEPEIRTAAETEPEAIEVAESAAAETRSQLDSAVARNHEAVRRVDQLTDLCGALWAAVEHIAPLQRRYDELAGLAEVVSGRGANNRRMSLRSYVLAARLEEVALAGSVRLRRMSGGRYEFVHSDAAGPGVLRGGLGLDVRDDYTGAVRPAKTLSGGETFMASLALALGLADVVMAESGGLVLDTLFIDEGFGSLDADTLDAVMGVLDELRSGGRVVGIVSHVDEMRQRIPSRLHVIHGAAGSRLETVVT